MHVPAAYYRSDERIAAVIALIINGLLLLACYYITFSDQSPRPFGQHQSSEPPASAPARVSYYNPPLAEATPETEFDTASDNAPIIRHEPDAAEIITTEPVSLDETVEQPERSPESYRPTTDNIPSTISVPQLPPRGQAQNRWRKKKAQKPPIHTAAALIDQVRQERRATRQAEAVYQRTDARGHIAAHLHEIRNDRYRKQVALALHAASVEHRKIFHAVKPVYKDIELRIVITENGDIMSVEFATSTGYPELDTHIAELIYTCKRLPIPPTQQAHNGCYIISLPTRVSCDGTSQVLGFMYHDGGGDIIL